MFSASDNMLSIGVPALRIISLSFIIAGFNIATSGSFQGTGKAVYSMAVSIARQLIVLLPVAYGLAQLGNVDLVWWAFPISECFSLAMTIVLLLRLNRSVLSKIGK
jgi:Na+-driven multidrug efflux pump